MSRPLTATLNQFNDQQFQAFLGAVLPLAKSLKRQGVVFKGEAFQDTMREAVLKQFAKENQATETASGETMSQGTNESHKEKLKALAATMTEIGEQLEGAEDGKELGEALQLTAINILERAKENEQQRLLSQERAREDLLLQQREKEEERKEEGRTKDTGKGGDALSSACHDIAEMLWGRNQMKQAVKGLERAGVELTEGDMCPVPPLAATRKPHRGAELGG
jgi:hypothetical protein